MSDDEVSNLPLPEVEEPTDEGEYVEDDEDEFSENNLDDIEFADDMLEEGEEI